MLRKFVITLAIFFAPGLAISIADALPPGAGAPVLGALLVAVLFVLPTAPFKRAYERLCEAGRRLERLRSEASGP